MSSRQRAVAVLVPLLLATGVGLTRARGADEPKPADGIDYAKWAALTPEPVPMAAAFAALCRLPTKEVKELRDRAGPHATAAVKYLANADAAKALKDDPKAVLPVGGAIVKEKLADTAKGAKLTGYGAMIKREKGYDPDHGEGVRVRRPERGAAEGGARQARLVHPVPRARQGPRLPVPDAPRQGG